MFVELFTLCEDSIFTNDIYLNIASYLFFSITIMAIRVGLAHNYFIMVLVEGWGLKP